MPGKNFPPPNSFRYSQITGESISVEPSSSTSTGIFPSGLVLRRSSLTAGLVGISSTSRAKSSSRMMMRALRAKGEAGDM
jgi:hypothetical protein